MVYNPLHKAYYNLTADAYEELYNSRYNSEFTVHFPIAIKQINRKNSYFSFFCYCQDINKKISDIRINLLRLQDLIAKIPCYAVIQYSKFCLTEEIQCTNHIEGIKSTIQEIQVAMSPNATKYTPFFFVVDKYIRIIKKENMSFNEPKDIRDFYDKFIRYEIQRDDPENLPDGDLFRKGPVEIGVPYKKPIHQGIYPETQIFQHLEQALQILHNTSMDPLINIAIFHYFFGYIHPFYDGNGRLNRFITSYFLAQNLHSTIALRLSVIIKKQRSKYYNLFEQTTSEFNRGDLTPFVLGFLSFILDATIETKEQLTSRNLQAFKQFLPQIPNYKDKLTSEICDLLLDITIFSELGFSNADLAEILGKNIRTIDAKLKTLPDKLLMQEKLQRRTYYRFNLEELQKL